MVTKIILFILGIDTNLIELNEENVEIIKELQDVKNELIQDRNRLELELHKSLAEKEGLLKGINKSNSVSVITNSGYTYSFILGGVVIVGGIILLVAMNPNYFESLNTILTSLVEIGANNTDRISNELFNLTLKINEIKNEISLADDKIIRILLAIKEIRARARGE